jgi:hypothetical protein
MSNSLIVISQQHKIKDIFITLNINGFKDLKIWTQDIGILNSIILVPQFFLKVKCLILRYTVLKAYRSIVLI